MSYSIPSYNQHILPRWMWSDATQDKVNEARAWNLIDAVLDGTLEQYWESAKIANCQDEALYYLRHLQSALDRPFPITTRLFGCDIKITEDRIIAHTETSIYRESRAISTLDCLEMKIALFKILDTNAEHSLGVRIKLGRLLYEAEALDWQMNEETRSEIKEDLQSLVNNVLKKANMPTGAQADFNLIIDYQLATGAPDRARVIADIVKFNWDDPYFDHENFLNSLNGNDINILFQSNEKTLKEVLNREGNSALFCEITDMDIDAKRKYLFLVCSSITERNNRNAPEPSQKYPPFVFDRLQPSQHSF